MASKNFISIITKNYFNVEVSLIVDKRYERKDGKYNVNIMFYYDRLYHFYQTGLKVKDWNETSSREQQTIYKIYDKSYELVCDLVDKEIFSFNEFKNQINAPKIETLNAFMAARIEQYKANNQFSTAGHYTAALNHFNNICGDVTFSRVNKDIVSKYKKHLEEEFSQSTTLIYLSDLKSIINEAMYKKLIKEVNYPFKKNAYDREKIEMPKATTRINAFLDKQEMMQIFDYYEKTKDEYIGLFLFSYLAGGMNLVDVLKLKYNQHYYNTECKELCYKRTKTEKKNDFFIRIAISDKMRELIPEPSENPDDYVFTYLRNCKNEKEIRNKRFTISNLVNYHLKKMCKELNLNKDITPTFARHSFATILRREFVPSEFVEYAMGHSLKGAAGNYFGGFTTDQLLKYSSYLIA